MPVGFLARCGSYHRSKADPVAAQRTALGAGATFEDAAVLAIVQVEARLSGEAGTVQASDVGRLPYGMFVELLHPRSVAGANRHRLVAAGPWSPPGPFIRLSLEMSIPVSLVVVTGCARR